MNLTKRDRLMIEWLGRNRYMTAALLTDLTGSPGAEIRRRLPVLREAGYVVRNNSLLKEFLWRATPKGLKELGIEWLAVERWPKWTTISHTLAVAEVAIQYHHDGYDPEPDHSIARTIYWQRVGELESDQTSRSWPTIMRGVLIPDILVFAHDGSRVEAVEIELHRKKRELIEDKLRQYLQMGLPVVYKTDDPYVEALVARAGRVTGAGDLLTIEPLNRKTFVDRG